MYGPIFIKELDLQMLYYIEHFIIQYKCHKMKHLECGLNAFTFQVSHCQY